MPVALDKCPVEGLSKTNDRASASSTPDRSGTHTQHTDAPPAWILLSLLHSTAARHSVPKARLAAWEPAVRGAIRRTWRPFSLGRPSTQSTAPPGPANVAPRRTASCTMSSELIGDDHSPQALAVFFIARVSAAVCWRRKRNANCLPVPNDDRVYQTPKVTDFRHSSITHLHFCSLRRRVCSQAQLAQHAPALQLLRESAP